MPSDTPIYLDHAATTPVAPEVFEAMRPFFCECYANPATLYHSGRRAGDAVEAARRQLAALIGAGPGQILFTSGGTESDNWALKAVLCRGPKKHLITCAIEHQAVLAVGRFLAEQAGGDLTVLPVDGHGLVDPDELRRAIRPDTALVSIMHANNEVGTLEPVAELAAIARERGVLFHTDAVQTVGKIPIDVRQLGIDLLSVSAHKLNGPKGVGALYVRQGVRLGAWQHGGRQESQLRAGTVNVPGAVGLGAAAELAGRNLEANGRREWALVEKLWGGISGRIAHVRRHGHPAKRIPGILNVSFDGTEGEAVLLQLDNLGIEAAAGSACASGSGDISHVLKAMGLSPNSARAAIRFSVGRTTTGDQIDRVLSALPSIIGRLRDLNPLWKTPE